MSDTWTDGLGRREVLAGVGSAIAVAGTGCVGGGSSGPDSGDDTITTAAEQLPTPNRGPDDAEVTVAIYKDYACPHCATFTESADPRIVEEYVDPGVVQVEHHDFPIPVDDSVSYRAANAAREVQASADDEAFFAYAKRLFENQSDLDLATYADLAESVDGEAVRRAADGRIYRETITADREAGVDRGVQGTPAVFVDDEQLDQWSWDRFESAVESARS